ncbi:MAG: glycosyltransferase [Sphingomonas phyllosphaerae]|uniref:glycosyltransferase n=1 Tax=Sphingomonas phyllosphaerae TaxID=257003 RepID=UPI002FFA7FC0
MTLISIVIPTHNRQIYAAAAVRKILDVLPGAQVIVSDTSADDRLRGMLPASGVEYLRPGQPMDVVSHFEFALAPARGRYVMFLGDDDCVGPGLAEIAEWAERCGVDAVVSYGTHFIANYFWPGVQSRFYGDGYASRLFVLPFSGKAHKIDPIAALRRGLDKLGAGLDNMPRIYHGLVSRSLIDRIKHRHGTLFGGVTPDIYSAALICANAENSWQVDYPFCIPGGSPSSTAGTGAAGSDMTSLSQHPHTAAFANLHWDSAIPEFYAPHTVWAYSLKKAIDLIGRNDLEPNLARIYAVSLLRNRRQRGKITASRQSTATGWTKIAREMARELGFQAGRYATRLRAPKAGGHALSFDGLQDISAAYDRLEQYIKEQHVALQLPDCEGSAIAVPGATLDVNLKTESVR